MRITLELNNKQVGYLKKALETSLSSLAWEESKVKDALDATTNTPEQEANLQTYLVDTASQRVLVAEILGNILDADPEHRILTDTIMPTNLNGRKSKRS